MTSPPGLATAAHVADLRWYKGAIAITPADGSDLVTKPAAGLIVGTGGTLKIDTYAPDGETRVDVTFGSLPDGFILPLPILKVYATGTDASNLVAVY